MSKEKTFYHAMPNSTCVLPSGRVITFPVGGLVASKDDEELQTELGKIVDKPGTMVTSTGEKAVKDQAITDAAVSVQDQAAKVAAAVAAAGPKG